MPTAEYIRSYSRPPQGHKLAELISSCMLKSIDTLHKFYGAPFDCPFGCPFSERLRKELGWGRAGAWGGIVCNETVLFEDGPCDRGSTTSRSHRSNIKLTDERKGPSLQLQITSNGREKKARNKAHSTSASRNQQTPTVVSPCPTTTIPFFFYQRSASVLPVLQCCTWVAALDSCAPRNTGAFTLQAAAETPARKVFT